MSDRLREEATYRISKLGAALEAKDRIIASQRIAHEQDAARIDELESEVAGAWHDHGVMVKQYEHQLKENERLRAALETAHDVLANGGDLKKDTFATRCNRALAVTREALAAVEGQE